MSKSNRSYKAEKRRKELKRLQKKEKKRAKLRNKSDVDEEEKNPTLDEQQEEEGKRDIEE